MLDLGILLAIVAVATAAWEFRRRRRSNAFQFRLIEFFVVTTLIAGVLAWMHSHSEAYETEVKVMKTIYSDEYMPYEGDPFRRSTAPVWLQRLVGTGYLLISFNRVHEVHIDLDAQRTAENEILLSCFQQLEYLQTISIMSDSEEAAEKLRAAIREKLPHIVFEEWLH